MWEYGSGNSSHYYLRRGANVISIEDDREWYENIRSEINNDAHEYVFALSKEEYINREKIKTADVIAIDGLHRSECADYAIQNISESDSNPAMIIFDNWDRHPKTIKKLDDKIGWVRADFCGFGPINSYSWVTSI